jgi:hypothetical protein
VGWTWATLKKSPGACSITWDDILPLNIMLCAGSIMAGFNMRNRRAEFARIERENQVRGRCGGLACAAGACRSKGGGPISNSATTSVVVIEQPVVTSNGACAAVVLAYIAHAPFPAYALLAQATRSLLYPPLPLFPHSALLSLVFL